MHNFLFKEVKTSPILTSKKSIINNEDFYLDNETENKENFETTTTSHITTKNNCDSIDDDKDMITISDTENENNEDIISLEDNSETDSSISEVKNSKEKTKEAVIDLEECETIDSDFPDIGELEKSAIKKKCVIEPEIPEEEKYHFISTLKYDRSNKKESEVQIKIPKVEYYEKNNWIFTDIKDCSEFYHKFNYKHSEKMFKVFSNDFGLKAFRPQQFGAINAALEG